jgi:hypothetical protein
VVCAGTELIAAVPMPIRGAGGTGLIRVYFGF